MASPATRRGSVVTLAAACALTLAAVPAVTSAPATAADIPGTNGAAVPAALRWGSCKGAAPKRSEVREEYRCTTVRVPLSYADPFGPQIQLALGLLPATDRAHKIGTLFWNPGGPGEPGRFPPVFSRRLRERFDLVGFDPRGVGRSTQLRCFESNRQAARLFGWNFPVTRPQEREVIALTRRATDACAINAGQIITHMSTANVARDLDLLRQAVGDEQLSYVGFSYGTALGEYYANLFPDRVRALTLDGVIDPVEWTTGHSPGDENLPLETRIGPFFGTRDALDSFLAACAEDARCKFHDKSADLERKYEALLSRVRRAPVVIRDDGKKRTISYQELVGGTLDRLYSASASKDLGKFLQAAWQASLQPPSTRTKNAAHTPKLAASAPRAPKEEPYDGSEAFSGVACTDSLNPTDPSLWPDHARTADRLAGPFGSPWTYGSLPCATWPAHDEDRYLGPWDKPTANPILLIGNSRGDPATPYEDAVAASHELADARLLTYDSWGHTAQGGHSRCIDAAVDAYLIHLKLPAENTVCGPDRGPFDPARREPATDHSGRRPS